MATNVSSVVKEIEKGSLKGSLQEVNITSSMHLSQGEFLLVFQLKDLSFMESAPISVNNTATEIESIINKINGIGLVKLFMNEQELNR
jgi:hypothetical protein